MKKVIVLSLSLIICFSLSACGKKSVKKDAQVIEPNGGLVVKENKTLFGWLKKGKAVECIIDSPEGQVIIKTKNEAVRMEGIQYLSSDPNAEQPKAENGVMLTVGDWMYMWDTSTKKGTKMNYKELEEMGLAEKETGDEYNEKEWSKMVKAWDDMNVDYKCNEVKIDDKLFSKPEDVDFVDLAGMMTDMQKGADELIKNLGNPEDMNQEDIEAMLEDMEIESPEDISREDLLK